MKRLKASKTGISSSPRGGSFLAGDSSAEEFSGSAREPNLGTEDDFFHLQ
jgi:hypothetical protein